MSDGPFLDPRPHVLPATASVADAMRRMTETGIDIVLITDQAGRFEGLAVDSDLRRALLADADMGRPLDRVMNRSPQVASADAPVEELKNLTRDVAHPFLPLVDEHYMLRGLVHVWALQREHAELPYAALVMAGGRGERLRPLTESRPKPMVEVGKRPILETIVGHLAREGIKRIYLSVNYLAEQIESHFGDGDAFGVEIEYLREDEPRGTAGALALLRGREERPLLMMNGDVLTRLNPRALMDFHRQESVQATVAVRTIQVDIPFGVVRMDESRLAGIEEKPSYFYYVNAGLYVLEPDTFSLVPRQGRYDMPQLLEAVEAATPRSIACFPVPEYWIDVGRLGDLDQARQEYHQVFRPA